MNDNERKQQDLGTLESGEGDDVEKKDTADSCNSLGGRDCDVSNNEESMASFEVKFIGTLKEIEYASDRTVLKFVPVQECTVTHKYNGKEMKYVVFVPSKDNTKGLVFRYDAKVCVEIKKGESSGDERTKVEWYPTWKLKGNYTLVFTSSSASADKCVVSMGEEKNVTQQEFRLESVIEME